MTPRKKRHICNESDDEQSINEQSINEQSTNHEFDSDHGQSSNHEEKTNQQFDSDHGQSWQDKKHVNNHKIRNASDFFDGEAINEDNEENDDDDDNDNDSENDDDRALIDDEEYDDDDDEIMRGLDHKAFDQDRIRHEDEQFVSRFEEKLTVSASVNPRTESQQRVESRHHYSSINASESQSSILHSTRDHETPTGIDDFVRTLPIGENAERINLQDFETFQELDNRILEMVARHLQNDQLFHRDDIFHVFRLLERYWKANETDESELIADDTSMESMKVRFLGERSTRPSDLNALSKLVTERKTKALNIVEAFTLVMKRHQLLPENDIGRLIATRSNNLLRMISAVADACNTDIRVQGFRRGIHVQNVVNSVVPETNLAADVDNVFSDSKDLNELQHLMIFLAQKAQERGFRKLNDRLYAEVMTKDGLPTHAYADVCSVAEFLEHITSRQKNLQAWKWKTKKPNNGPSAVIEFIKNHDLTCPRLERDRAVWSFSNGVYDGNRDLFIPHGPRYRHLLPTKFAIKYFDQEFLDTDPVGPDWQELPDGRCVNEFGDIIYDKNLPEGPDNKKPVRSFMQMKTPKIMQILGKNGQQWSREVIKTFFEVIGRLAFPVGEQNGGDNYAFCPLFYGKAGTGKTTLVEFFCNMYEPSDIFDMESKGEETFMLQGIFTNSNERIQKKIWRVGELKKDFRLTATRYQVMVEGGKMPIPIKGGLAPEIFWSAPGVMIGNERLPFVDCQGSISRRTLVFEYNEVVKKVDVGLRESLRKEWSIALRKCIVARKYMMKRIGRRGIWAQGSFPEYFHNTSKSFRRNVDTVAYFISKRCVMNQQLPYLIPFEIFMEALTSDPKNKGKTLDDDQARASIEAYGCKMFQINAAKETYQETDMEEESNSDDDSNSDINSSSESESDDEKSISIGSRIGSGKSSKNTSVLGQRVKAILPSDEYEKIASITYDSKIYKSGFFIQGLVFDTVSDPTKIMKITYHTEKNNTENLEKTIRSEIASLDATVEEIIEDDE